MSIDWSKAPEGATHCLIKDSGTAWFRFKDDLSFPNTWKDGEWKNVRLPTRELTPKPKQPKRLTQAVFDGLPPEYRWAYLDRDGDPCVIGDFEAELDARFPDHQPGCYEDGLELAAWMDSVLWRKESIHDVARSIEAARQVEATLAERQGQYGDFKDVAHLSQGLQSLLSVGNFSDTQQEAMQMICSKLARLACGDADHVDSWHDIAGYATLVVKDLESAK